MKTAPLLSIGMIFKNEERCLERCLKSLQPLRDAIPCELVMADTGAEDGSRAIAERYADEVFDFEWIDDFAAARNAVLDRCTGKWYLAIDSDEWLDEDISELVAFLNGNKKVDHAFVIQRNYETAELEKCERFDDFRALRLVRMAIGPRYHGAIHETFGYYDPVVWLTRTILHHDGYVFTDPVAKKKKLQRNMKLLRQKLEQKPESLRTLMQSIESGVDDADLIQYVRRAVDIVQGKRDQWERYGASILRHAVEKARVYEMPEFEDWLQLAAEMFPDSPFVRVDVNGSAFVAAYEGEDWEKSIQYGEAYQKGLRALRVKRKSEKLETELGVSGLHKGSPTIERTILLGLADSYFQNGQAEKALRLLTQMDAAKFDSIQIRNAMMLLCKLHSQSPLEVDSVLADLYEQIGRPEPNEKAGRLRLDMFNRTAPIFFSQTYQEDEQKKDGYCRPSYTLFYALAGKCDAGRAAAVMMANDPTEMYEWLLAVEDWQVLPIEALEHALHADVAFPPKGKPLSAEVLDGLAVRLTHEDNPARQIVLRLPDDAEYPSLQSLFWTQSLVFAALRSFDWKLGKSSETASKFACPEKKKEKSKVPECTAETGLALVRRFTHMEAFVLPLLYTPQMLTEENIALLPPLHRWGFFCTQAWDALDSGNPQEYLALLRKGLKA